MSLNLISTIFFCISMISLLATQYFTFNRLNIHMELICNLMDKIFNLDERIRVLEQNKISDLPPEVLMDNFLKGHREMIEKYHRKFNFEQEMEGKKTDE